MIDGVKSQQEERAFKMSEEYAHSLYLIYRSDFYLLCVSAIIFDLPRYVFGTIAYVILILTQPKIIPNFKPKISIVMSLLNGEANFWRNINALQQQTLKPLEIIIIDDGSTDATKSYAEEALDAGLITQFIHHDQPCGKDASVNHAVRFAKGDLILQIDDDTLITPDGIELLANVFEDETVGVASGNLPIRNKDDSLWTSLQAVEYLVSVEIGRSIQDLFGAVSCCSGAYMMFRKDVFLALGGHNVNSANDLELTLRIKELGYKARFVRESVAFVDAPVSLSALFKQRFRWDTDILRIRLMMFKSLKVFRPNESLADTLTRLDFSLFEFLQTLIFPFYIAWLFARLQDLAVPYFILMYLFMLLIYIFNIALSILSTKQKFSLFDASTILIFPLYQGVILKMLRFVAFSCEIFYNATHDDDAIPPKVRKALYFK